MVSDFSDLHKLAADLGDVPKKAGPLVRKAVEVTARHVRDDYREPLQGSATVPAGAASVTYDIKGSATSGGSSIRAEIGPELGRAQGPIVGILDEGSATESPRGFGLAALQKNQADFERGLSIALGGVL